MTVYNGRPEVAAAQLPAYLAEPLTRLRATLEDAASPRVVGGVCAAARAIAVAALARHDEPTLVVVPGPRDVEELAAGLELLAPTLRVASLPAEAADAYLGRVTPLGATATAALALARVARRDLDLLVAPARLLPFPFPEPASLPPRSPRLTVGERLDLRDLAARLVAAGYRRVEVVEEAGEFAVRGEILDLSTPEQCVRIVLDVDRVESLRAFDCTNQRSLDKVAVVVVPPLRLFPTGDDARTALAARLESEGCAAVAAQALDGASPEHWEALLGLVLPHTSLVRLTRHIVVVERSDVLAEVERLHTALRHAWEALGQRGVTLPPPEAWLLRRDGCEHALAGADHIVELPLSIGGCTASLHTSPAPALATRPQLLLEELRRGIAEETTQVVVAASSGEEQRLEHLLAPAELTLRRGWPDRGQIGAVRGALPHGFAWRDAGLVIYGRNDVTTLPAPSRRRRSLAVVLAEMRDLKVGDFVVHADHGIARFAGFRTLTHDHASHECVELEYAGGGKLLVPLERADVLEKYASAEEGTPPRLDRLGGSSWARTKARVKKALKDLADELLKVQAQRELAPGFAYSKDSPWQKEFEGAFEYELTSDQELAVREVKRDLEASRPMDRLLVGDVGYGKTEVAIRACFKAVLDGKQVAVLAPTTILAEQHYRTFTRRFAGFPVEIRWLSRFIAPAEQKAVAAGIREGTVDIAIGTHRLLAKDVSFRDLGLLIIDEEQRFGVAQKERLKRLKSSVDVLALSATPIPRTLNLGLLGLRDVSIIETPPRDRLAVQTHVLPFRKELVREAILTEMARGGQTFFVHNRVASIGAIANLLRDTVPEARFAVAHGQMHERELERAMSAFLEGRADVLLATAIIENGLDIPNANTLLVNRADRFGLAQLYQLRGRVGRSDRLAFAYFLVPPDTALSEEARQRLAAIVEFAELGAGFRIAARDLEIRGAGNILGAEQHGHLRAVGYETYCRLLEEAVREMRGEEAPPPPSAVELRLGMDLKLPERYIPEESLRLTVYRRIAAAHTDEELAQLEEEFADRFGPPPPQLRNLLLHQRLRRRAEALGATRVSRSRIGVEITLDPGRPSAHAVAMTVLGRVTGASLTPAGVLRLPIEERDPATSAERLLDSLPAA